MPTPFPFYLVVLKLAQASSFYSRLLSFGKNVMKLGGGTGRRRTSNYRATEGISGRGYCIKQEAHIERGLAGSGWLSPDPEPVATSWALSSSTMTTGKPAAPTGGSNGTDKALPSGGV